MKRKTTLALALGTVFLATGALGGEARRGFYTGIELGLASATDLNSAVSGVNHPTRCDQLLRSTPPVASDNVLPLTDAACQVGGAQPLSLNAFDPGTGFVGAVSLGYSLDRLRVEFEYLNRSHGDDSRLLQAAPGNAPLGSKADEWSELDPPSERIAEFRAHQFFLNAYYDFVNQSRWTPYLGAGVGWAHTRLRYENRFVRKTIAQGYLLDENDQPLTGDAVRPPAAAGTISFLNTGLSETLFGFQLLGGLDYALTEQVSVGVKGRWARFQDLDDDDVWDLIRSHRPVQADGVTPFRSTQAFSDIEYWAVTFGLKYHF